MNLSGSTFSACAGKRVAGPECALISAGFCGSKLADPVDQQRDKSHQYEDCKEPPPDRVPAMAAGMFAVASVGHVLFMKSDPDILN